MRQLWAVGMAAAALAGCVPAAQAPITAPTPTEVYALPGGQLAPEQAARNFVSVVSRVEPMIENICLTRTQNVNCDFQIAVDDRMDQPPNAFQTLDAQGRPILAFTISLIADARNADEIAFVLGHEASHHILGHIPQQQQSARAGAVMAGILVQAAGGNAQEVRSAQEMGATMGARTYAKDFELQADAMGAEIAWRAGYDPVRGAGFFDRLPDPGDQFLGSHPPNQQRKALVARVVADLSGV